MDSRDFYEGLKTDHEQNDEFTAGAEHFVRLKKQVGLSEQEDLQKEAGAADSLRELAKKNPYARAAIISGATMGTLGAGQEALTKGPEKGKRAVKGAVRGAAVGAGAGALGHHLQQKLATRRKVKKAGVADKLRQVDPLLPLIMGGGAAIGGVGTYLSSRPREELGGRSSNELETEGRLLANHLRGEEGAGLIRKMRNRNAELEHGYARAFREHPVKAGLLGAGMGAGAGFSLARIVDAVKRGRK